MAVRARQHWGPPTLLLSIPLWPGQTLSSCGIRDCAFRIHPRGSLGCRQRSRRGAWRAVTATACAEGANEGIRSVKGLAVLALGAILIWFGLSRHDGASGPTVHAGTSEDGAVSGSSRRKEAPLNLDPRQDSGAATRPAQAGLQLGGARAADREAELERAARAAEAQAAADAAAQEMLAPEDPFEPGENELASGASRGLAQPASSYGSQGEPLRPASPREISLAGAGGPSPERAATILLEAWIAEDPSNLETYLTQGEGLDMSEVQRQLVASFWQAVAGKPDAGRRGFEEIRGADGVTTAQESLLSAALDVPGNRAVPRSASAGRVEPLTYAMRMILLEDEAQHLLSKREYGRSAVSWSDLIQYEVNAPWEPHRNALLQWGRELSKAQVNHRFNVNGSWPSIEEKVQPGGSLIRLRKRVLKRRGDLVLCTGLIGQVNGVSGYVHAGDVMRIPTDRVNVIVDLDARVLLYRHGDEVVRVWDIGIGKPGHETPIGVYHVGHKIEKPAHTTKGLPYGDPDNPLGSRWMGLRRPGQKSDTSYGIHGTSLPDGVGGAVSLGCVRMRNGDVDELFEILPSQAEVVIQS